MAVVVRKVSDNAYVWSCTTCSKPGSSGSAKTEGQARAKYAAHAKKAH